MATVQSLIHTVTTICFLTNTGGVRGISKETDKNRPGGGAGTPESLAFAP